MLSAVAFSSVFEHYMGDDTKREKPPAEDSSDEDDKRNSGNLYDKARRGEVTLILLISKRAGGISTRLIFVMIKKLD